MVYVILVVIGVFWLLGAIGEGISSASAKRSAARAEQEKFKAEREAKYNERVIDTSQGLFERNQDIIQKFEKGIKATSPRSYSYGRYRSYSDHYIENETRDCINEIALAENKWNVRPGTTYLVNWRPTAPKDWVELSQHIEKLLTERQQQLQKEEKEETARWQAAENARAEKERKLRLEQWEREETIKEVERNVKRYSVEFRNMKADRKDPLLLKKIQKRNERGDLQIEDIPLILGADLHPWSEREEELMSMVYKVKPFPLFSSDAETQHKPASIYALNSEIAEFNKTVESDTQQGKDVRDFFRNIYKGYESSVKESVIERFNFVLNSIVLPPSIPKVWDVDFDPDQSILIAEIKLPDVVHNQVFKEVVLKKSTVKKPLTIKEQREIVPNIHPAIMLRTAYEIFRNDKAGVIKLLVLNGWVEFDDPATGNITRTYTASLAVEKDKIVNLKLSKLDPIAAFAGLKGRSAGKLIDIIPVSPMLSLDRKDKRFIETREVLGNLDSSTNLASMDWQDFENLIAELFQKEFAGEGTEIKLTQSSRDKGVDAVVINPDPIRGGKYVIQAKRYTHTVDVSAVRDLVAVVAHEGASRGILVTTSTFGADAYAFVQNKPITLLDGAKLLGLLEKHNYKFKINLAEARKLNLANEKSV